jgi:RNA polymerase sigma-70 factor (ECF subfamily)
MTLSDVVQQAQAGDEAAFERLYREHAGRVYSLCLRLVCDGRRAEELVQDVFVRAWERLGSFRGESAFSSWLHRLAVNVVYAARREESRRERRVSPTDDLDAVGAATRDPPDGLAQDLEQAIAGLPEGARTVLVLYDIEGYGHAEIAELTGIAEGTSKAQLHRARRLMREALDR